MEGDMSAAAIEVLVQNLINVFKEEYSLIRGLDKDAKQLQTTLGMIQGYLNDAENKSISQDAVKIWLRELEALAFDADDVLDELTYHLLHKQVKKIKTRKIKVLSCFSSLNRIVRPRNMALKIKQINADFDSMNKRATELCLQSIVVNAPLAPHASFETDSFTLDPIFIGRDDVVSELVEMLSEDPPEEQTLSVVAVVGMGGMGKTTLTRKIVGHEKMRVRFGSLIWVHVSQTFDPIILFKKILSILSSLTSSNQHGVDNGVENREVLLRRLQEALRSKTYLLVLDDVWNDDQQKWEDFINSLLGVTSTKGNGIIMTTRNTEVASITNPVHIHRLKGLSDEACWSIIKRKTFAEVEAPLAFEMIGRKIARRCQGLPLAANVVGGLLRHKSEQDWLSIEQKWISDAEGGRNISKILKLSFDNLSSPSLKKCFAYCSIFPKGHRIVKRELIELWMAEGFLQTDPRIEMECLGEMFLNVLLHNSLLQVARRDDYGDVESCVMHDLVHDLATSVLGADRNRARYVFYEYYGENPSPTPKELAKHLRTLYYQMWELSFSDFNLSEFKCLHVLTLTCFHVKALPSSIGKLIHLRKLNISKTYIQHLPDSIGELHHLQTLRANIQLLRKLPSTFICLISLRHLFIHRYMETPPEIGRLTSLRTLTHFSVSNKKGYRIEELASLKNLQGGVCISNLENVRGMEEAKRANISQKPNLLELQFSWDGVREGLLRNDEAVLEGLQPHSNLKKLEIEGFGGARFPAWVEMMAVRDEEGSSWIPLDKLVQLKLSLCEGCEEIPMLEHLPNLKSLSLDALVKVRFINSSFTNLTKLHISYLVELECLPDWLFYNNPNLSKFEIDCCPKLTELPQGLSTLASLEELSISSCENLKWIGNDDGVQSQGMLLRRLSVKFCRGLMELPRGTMESWAPSLEILELVDLSSLKNLPTVIDCLAGSPRLRDLRIIGVPKFMATTASVGRRWPFGSMWWLQIDASVEYMPSEGGSVDNVKETVERMLQGCSSSSNSSSLNTLILKGVESWKSLPEAIRNLNSVTWLDLENFGMEELPPWLGNLTSLRRLSLRSCNKLRRLDALEGITNLGTFDIEGCEELRNYSDWHKINHPYLTIQVDGTYI